VARPRRLRRQANFPLHGGWQGNELEKYATGYQMSYEYRTKSGMTKVVLRGSLCRLQRLQELHLEMLRARTKILTVAEAYHEEQEPEVVESAPDDIIAARRCDADCCFETPAWGTPQLLRVTDQFSHRFSKAMLSWLHAQCLSNDAISIRFSFLECGHSNELPQPHSSLKNTWIASTSLCTPPTIAAVVRLMRHFYSALFPLAPPKEEGIDLLFCGAHTTQAGFPFVVSLSSVKLAAALLRAFTSPRPIRTANDLARPLLCSSSFSR